MRRSILFLAALPFLVSAAPVRRCDCGPVAEVPNALHEATAVFSGRVVSARWGKIRLRVERAWKGTAPGEMVEMKGPTWQPDGALHMTMCDIIFEVGKSYLVYAHLSEGSLVTNVCTRTVPMERAAEDIGELDNPAPVQPDNDRPTFFCGGVIDVDSPDESDTPFRHILIGIMNYLNLEPHRHTT